MESVQSKKESWISNGTQVIVTMKNGTSIEGKIVGGDYNVCTFKKEYEVLLFDMVGCRTMIGVPESAITIKA